jgi:hypothetical protein
LDEKEFERIAELAKLQLDDAEEDLKEAQEEDEGSDEGQNKVENHESMEVEGETTTAKVKFVNPIRTRNARYRLLTNRPIDTTMTTSKSTI